MVTLNENKENFVTDESPDETLREERRRTGRFVATVIAIFVSLFGLYQATARGTPEYAAFFLPALIMFLYVLWILYASRYRTKDSADQLANTEELQEIKSTVASCVVKSAVSKPSTSHNKHNFSRSYSIA